MTAVRVLILFNNLFAVAKLRVENLTVIGDFSGQISRVSDDGEEIMALKAQHTDRQW